MSRLTTWIDRTFYPDYGDRWDDRLFERRVSDIIEPDSDVLDLGAGRGTRGRMNFRGRCRFFAGVDPDEAVLTNPYLDEAKLQQPPDYLIPYPDAAFDVVFSNCVIEHISDAERFFGEIYRVLRPRGVFLAKTPNRCHYVPLLARLTPHWFHEFYNRLRGREADDTFPTTYACNRKGDLIRIAEATWFRVVSLEMIEGRPEYLRLNSLLYLGGLAYERMVNRFDALAGLRAVIILQLEKPA